MNSCCLFSLLGCIDRIESGQFPLRDDLDALCATATHKQYTYVSEPWGNEQNLKKVPSLVDALGGGGFCRENCWHEFSEFGSFQNELQFGD